jgi:hypothetical protein
MNFERPTEYTYAYALLHSRKRIPRPRLLDTLIAIHILKYHTVTVPYVRTEQAIPSSGDARCCVVALVPWRGVQTVHRYVPTS